MNSTDATSKHAAPASAASLDDPRLMRAMEEYAELLHTGPRPDRAEFLARHADIADALGRCLDGLEFVHDAGQNLSRSESNGTDRIDLLTSGVPLGDYQLLRELGRGGMGIVYEAEQLSLGRRVALKVLPYAATMDSKQLQRFKNEARAAASLHHEHIVPVHGVGCERGVHYYAMQLIDGQTLAQVIVWRAGSRERPVDDQMSPALGNHGALTQPRSPDSPTATIAFLSTERSGPKGRAFYRTAAKLIAQAADALEHAHSLGIVHRDIKPGNLMVDAAGKLWVTDFGLARFGTDASLTASSDVLGTLRYMAPEQALAKHGLVDHRADIYALGTTLYELLTGRPAVDAAERAEILRKIAFDEPTPPRKLERSIPAELDIIALKCLAKTPDERYASAGELADDLRRFAEDKPIRARRPTMRQRLGWLARRHPVASAALALVAGLLLAGAWAWDRQRALAEGTARLVEAQAAEHQAAGRYSEALAIAQRAVDLLPRFGDTGLRRQLEERVADLNLLHKVEEARLEGAAVKDDGAGFDNERIAPAIRQAFLEYGVDVIGRNEIAVADQLRRRTIRTEIVAALHEWSSATGDNGTRQRLRQLIDAVDPDGIASQVRRAIQGKDEEALKRLAAELAPNASPQLLLSLALRLNGVSASDAAERLLRAGLHRYPSDFWLNVMMSQTILQSGKREGGSITPERSAEALSYCRITLAQRPESAGVWLNVGQRLKDLKRYEEAEVALHRAIELKKNWTSAYIEMGKLQLNCLNRPAAAVDYLRHAIALKPDDTVAHFLTFRSLYQIGRYAEAAAACRRLTELKPDVAMHYNNLGALLCDKLGRPEEAVGAFRRAIELVPDDVKCMVNLGRALSKVGRPAEAIEAFRQAIKQKPDVADAHYSLGNALLEMDRLPEAEAAYREAIKQKPDDDFAYGNLGTTLAKLGRHAEAEVALRQAIKVNPEFANAYRNLGATLVKLGRLNEAETAIREAIKLEPNHASAYDILGVTLRRLGRLPEAETALRQAIKLEPESARAYGNLGAVFLQSGRQAEAEAALRKSIELDPHRPEVQRNLSRLLAKAGRDIEAIASCRRLIELAPEDVQAHRDLGALLRRQGQFAESLTEIRRAREVDSKQPGKPVAWAPMIHELEQLVQLDAKLPALLSGAAQPADIAEQVAAAWMCQQYKKLNATSVRFYIDAFTADPKLLDDMQRINRHSAARAAALAGCGQGADADTLNHAEKARLRRQALDWLTADLAACAKLAEKSEARPRTREFLAHWQQDADFNGVRGDGLAKLPAEEQEPWRRLWADVAALLAKIPNSNPPDKQP